MLFIIMDLNWNKWKPQMAKIKFRVNLVNKLYARKFYTYFMSM